MRIKGVRITTLIAAFLPANALRILAYRLLRGFRIGAGVRIAFSAILDADTAEIGDGTRIGALTIFKDVRVLRLGQGVRLAFFTRFMTADEVSIGDKTYVLTGTYIQGTTWMAELTGGKKTHRGRFIVGSNVAIGAGHFFDITNDIIIGSNGGVMSRNSTFWTHGISPDRGGPIRIGDNSWIGSDCKCVGNVTVPDNVMVSIGSVITRSIPEPNCVAGGVPARILKRQADWRKGREAVAGEPNRDDG